MKEYENNLQNTAVHEAGHAFIHALLAIPFTYVTIIPDQNVNHYGDTALGSLMPIWSYCGKESGSNPCLDPNDFIICFMEDLGIIAGMVAEMLYRKDEMNFTGSKSDLKQLNHNCRNKLPASIRHKYSSFLIAYAFNLLKQKENYYLILKIAEELLEHKTLSYGQVKKIVNR
jgi:ATP-dependent Zn protease